MLTTMTNVGADYGEWHGDGDGLGGGDDGVGGHHRQPRTTIATAKQVGQQCGRCQTSIVTSLAVAPVCVSRTEWIAINDTE